MLVCCQQQLQVLLPLVLLLLMLLQVLMLRFCWPLQVASLLMLQGSQHWQEVLWVLLLWVFWDNLRLLLLCMLGSQTKERESQLLVAAVSRPATTWGPHSTPSCNSKQLTAGLAVDATPRLKVDTGSCPGCTNEQ